MYYNERKDWKIVMRRADDNYENTSGTNYEFGDYNQTSYEPISLTTKQALALIEGDDDNKAEQKVGIDTTWSLLTQITPVAVGKYYKLWDRGDVGQFIMNGINKESEVNIKLYVTAMYPISQNDLLNKNYEDLENEILHSLVQTLIGYNINKQRTK